MLLPRSIFSTPADLPRDLRSTTAPAVGPSLRGLLFAIVIFGCIYGAVMGCYEGPHGIRIRQVLYSAVKVPLLLFLAFGMSLPSFWVLNSLLGLAEDFVVALRCLLATQAGLTLILASLAPFTAVWYLSNGNYREAQVFNAAMFTVASFAAQWHLRRCYAPLIARDPRHRWLLRVWLLIYAFVGIQSGWVLRPWLGDPTLPTTFFRKDSWGNAYIELAKITWMALGG